MKVKLQPPSNTELPAFNPILPPAAITQILLLANPQKVLTLIRLLTTFTSLCWFFYAVMLNHLFFLMRFRKKCVCVTSWHSTWGTDLTMNLVTSTTSLLQTPGATFSETDDPPLVWSAASFRFMLKLSLITGSGKTALYTSVSVWWRRLTWDQLWEPASTLCLAPQPSHRCSIRSIFPVCHSLFLPQQSDQTVIRCQKNIQCGDVWENNLSL